MNNDFKKLSEEYLKAPETGNGPRDRLEFMKLSRLDRIADALERINDTLESIDQSLDALEHSVFDLSLQE